MIIGTNAREGTLFPKVMDGLPTDAARSTRCRPHRSRRPRSCGRRVPRYPGVGRGDRTRRRPHVLEAVGSTLPTRFGAPPTYSYRFDYAPRLMHRLGLGATHAFELFAVFGYGESAAGRALTAYGGRRGTADGHRSGPGELDSFAGAVFRSRGGPGTTPRNGAP
ncbi:hypothetical protein GS416_06170 [Rhodococcus hoagii]|nr:hypothetical protein [Prescottella equi]